MSATPQPRRAAGGRLERASWIALIATVAIAPLAVSKLGWMELPLTYTSFAFPQTIALVTGVGVSLGLWALARVRSQADLSISWRLAPFAAFVAWAGVATAAAPEPLRALLGKSTSGFSLLVIGAAALLFFMVTQTASTGSRLRTLTRAVVYPAGVVASLALLQQMFGADIFGLPQIEAWMVGRGFSTMGNPDHLGTFLVMPALLASGLALTETDSRLRMLALATFGLLLAALAGTLTRGAWIGAIAGALVLLLLTRGSGRRGWAVAVVAVCAVAIALLAADPGDLGSRFRTSAPQQQVETDAPVAGAANAVLSDRLSLWQTSLDIAARRPLTGIGPASFELGWYPNARGTLSVGGSVPVGDDPHSLPVFALASTGVPGALTLVAAVWLTLVFGARSSLGLVRSGRTGDTPLLYIAWFAASAGLHVALLVAAISTPILTYAFLGLAVLIRPGLRLVSAEETAVRLLTAAAALVTGVLLLVSPLPALRAEMALARTLSSGAVDAARDAVTDVRWNMDVQRAYYHLSVGEVEALLSTRPEAAQMRMEPLVTDLASAGSAQPREYYYPSVRSQLLTQASGVFGSERYAEAAIAAADEALAIMPDSVPVRVQKALALGDLERYDEMAATLADHWGLETVSPYPGILYAQALALSGQAEEAGTTFDVLEERFPLDASVGEARRQTESLIGSP